mmetsp:Transcript_11153/g.35241  ORF Transcript_11153/g.35241 Transcript_11153/m.35241 type:complete len:400 (-) Transcript_11153:1262-2461(-)
MAALAPAQSGCSGGESDPTASSATARRLPGKVARGGREPGGSSKVCRRLRTARSTIGIAGGGTKRRTTEVEAAAPATATPRAARSRRARSARSARSLADAPTSAAALVVGNRRGGGGSECGGSGGTEVRGKARRAGWMRGSATMSAAALPAAPPCHAASGTAAAGGEATARGSTSERGARRARKREACRGAALEPDERRAVGWVRVRVRARASRMRGEQLGGEIWGDMGRYAASEPDERRAAGWGWEASSGVGRRESKEGLTAAFSAPSPPAAGAGSSAAHGVHAVPGQRGASREALTSARSLSSTVGTRNAPAACATARATPPPTAPPPAARLAAARRSSAAAAASHTGVAASTCSSGRSGVTLSGPAARVPPPTAGRPRAKGGSGGLISQRWQARSR